MTENSLVIFTRASLMLAEANTIQKAKELKDLALTAADWAKRKGMGEEAIQYARGYALDAERRMGELLRETERNKGAQGKGINQYNNEVQYPDDTAPPKLEDLGLTKKESSEAQQIADLPEEVYEDVRAGKKTKTQAKREVKRKAVIYKTEYTEWPEGKYRVIYADPPWDYGDKLTENYGPASLHYPEMSLSDICLLPVKELSLDNAVLFLWATSPMLPEALQVVTAWGFKYKASFVWDKVKHNMGHYNSVRHEFLLICTKGSCLPDVPELIDSVVSIERTDHSRKPEEFRNIIDKLYPHGPRIELFARTKHEGWYSYGNEL